MPSDTIIPVKVRTARKHHECSSCDGGIFPGDRYEDHVIPPNREPNFGGTWWRMASHLGAYRAPWTGRDEAAAYRENEERTGRG